MTEARRLANALIDNADLNAVEGGNPVVCKLERDAAALLRTQHAAIERKDALLRQALEMLGCTHEDDDPGHRCGYCDDYVDRNGILRAELRKELAK